MSKARSTRLARSCRRVPTPQEATMWEALRDRRLRGLKFRRQHPYRGYLLDFYCAKHSLVVELDGAVHLDPEQRAYDAFRNEVLQNRGLTVLRIRNDEIHNALHDVLERIAACARPHPAAPSPSKTDGEGEKE